MPEIARLSTREPGFDARLAALTRLEASQDEAVDSAVAAIVADVRTRGDAAVLEYTQRFDRVAAASVAGLEIAAAERERALAGLDPAVRDALATAAARIRGYHERQRAESWSYTEADGTVLGQRVTPLDRAGLYVPGGKAAYPSSVLMNALPAKVAGVGELVMCVPTPDGERNPLVLAAAQLAGVDRVFAIGGAQAVAALAYGTATIPAVDKIVGPGNAYVAAAKRRVFGTVGIDMVAGPSEILVICDGSTDPDWIAMDLFSQAEHDEGAQAILLAPDAAFIDRVAASIDRQLAAMPRREIIRAALANRGALILVRDLAEACDIANRIAPEHLELSVAEPERLLERIRHAGAIFVGRYSSEALGDYCAGPNHVLPTSRTARFSSPLGVYDFQKRSSIVNVSRAGARSLAPLAAALAQGEGLPAHARSAELRLETEP
jgi:histidinol dehydrogenase